MLGQCLPGCALGCASCQNNDGSLCRSCDNGYYFTNYSCVPCHKNCGACSGPEKNNCTSCDSTSINKFYHESLSECKDSCNSGFYLFQSSTDFVCKNCHVTCKECLSGEANHCTQCDISSANSHLNEVYNLTPARGTCDQQCITPRTLYDTANKKCKLICHSDCRTCSGPDATDCTQCTSAKFFRLNNSCLDRCPDQYRSGDSSANWTICEACPVGCRVCDNLNNCSSCVDPFIHSEQKCICPSGKRLQSTTCVDCAGLNCETCDASGNCTSCPSNFEMGLEGKNCYFNCPEGYYYNVTDQSCKRCHKSCQDCVGPEDNQCNKCLSIGINPSLSNGVCLYQCSNSTFLDKTSIYKCSNCGEFCVQCTNANNCTNCSSGKKMHGGKCYEYCPDGTFETPHSDSCQNCDSTCKTCTGNSQNNCLTCDPQSTSNSYFYPDQKICGPKCVDKYYEDPTTPKKCLLCDSRCKTCTYQAKRCLTCNTNRVWNSSRNWCDIKCGEGKYYSFESYNSEICKECSNTCLTCETHPEKCLSCTNEYTFIQEKFFCKLNCSGGTAWSSLNICSPCKAHCRACQDSTFKCTTCSEGYRKSLLDAQKCVKEYPEYLTTETQKFNTIKQKLTLEFSQQIQDSTEFLTKLKVGITNSDASIPKFKVISIRKVALSNRNLEITFDIESSLNQATIIIEDKTKVIKSEELLLPLKNGPGSSLSEGERTPGVLLLYQNRIKIGPLDLEVDSNQKTIEAVTSPIRGANSALTAALLISNPSSGIALLKLFQYFEFLRLINVEDIPSNFLTFLDIFNSNVFDISPNPFEMDETDPQKVETQKRKIKLMNSANQTGSNQRNLQLKTTYHVDSTGNINYCKLHPLLQTLEYDCFFLNNAGNLVFQVLLYLFLKLFCRFMRFKTSPGKGKKKSRIHAWMVKLDILMGLSFFVDLFIAIHLDTIITAFINVRNFWIKPFSYFFNSVLAFCFIGFYIYFIGTLSFQSFRLWKLRNRSRLQQKKYANEKGQGYEEDPWEFLKEQIDEKCNSLLGSLMDQILIVKDFIVAFFVVIFIENPYIQLIPSILIFLSAIILILRLKPYSSKIFFLTIIINELAYVFILASYFIYNIIKERISLKSRRAIFGYSMIIIVSLIIIFNLTSATIQVILTLKDCYQNRKKASKKKLAKLDKTLNESTLNLNSQQKMNDRLALQASSSSKKKNIIQKKLKKVDLDNKIIRIQKVNKAKNEVKMSKIQKKKKKKKGIRAKLSKKSALEKFPLPLDSREKKLKNLKKKLSIVARRNNRLRFSGNNPEKDRKKNRKVMRE